MNLYVVGFYFNENKSKVALIEKKRPSWQVGLLNGIGGKIEKNETPELAMCREFEEETGLLTETKDWEELCTLKGWDYEVWFFTMSGKDMNKLKAKTDEDIYTVRIDDIQKLKAIIPNLKWLIPMALEEKDWRYEISQLA